MILRAENVGKRYPNGNETIRVLDSARLELDAGEFLSIQGESGSGKTTFLNIISGLEQADEGQVFWNDQDVTILGADKLAMKRAAFIGMVFQSYYLVPELNALENVVLGARISGSANLKESKTRGEILLEKVGLGDRFKQNPGTLSGGERQRVAIARALVASPKVVLADEPTGNLDEKTGDAVMDLLCSLCRDMNTGLVLVTHNSDHAARADRSLHLRNGAMVIGN